MKTKCLVCNNEIELTEDPSIGLLVQCFYCNTYFEVTWLFPLTVDFVDGVSSTYHEIAYDEDD
jgi:hypothetical protein